jgi:hypothetical protein
VVLKAVADLAASSARLLLPDLPPKGDVSDWLDAGGTVAALVEQAERVLEPADEAPLVAATPFVWRDPSAIPLRPWVYGRWFLRNTITAVVRRAASANPH